jgi:transposase
MSIRRRHSLETKLRVVKEALETGNVSVVARRYDLSSSLASKWVRQYKRYGEAAFSTNSNGRSSTQQISYSEQEYRQLESENERLKKILGEKDLEVAILKDLAKKQNPPWLKK